MPTTDLTAGEQTATIQYGWDVFNRMQVGMLQKLPPEVLKKAAAAGGTDVDSIGALLTQLEATDILGVLVADADQKRNTITTVLRSVRSGAEVLYTKGNGGNIDAFLNEELDPILGHEILKYMAKALADYQTVISPKSEGGTDPRPGTPPTPNSTGTPKATTPDAA